CSATSTVQRGAPQQPLPPNLGCRAPRTSLRRVIERPFRRLRRPPPCNGVAPWRSRPDLGRRRLAGGRGQPGRRRRRRRSCGGTWADVSAVQQLRVLRRGGAELGRVGQARSAAAWRFGQRPECERRRGARQPPRSYSQLRGCTPSAVGLLGRRPRLHTRRRPSGFSESCDTSWEASTRLPQPRPTWPSL
ncbi:unnamed protein product, partial [Ectocarpus sp. 8 AP-2014]